MKIILVPLVLVMCISVIATPALAGSEMFGSTTPSVLTGKSSTICMSITHTHNVQNNSTQAITYTCTIQYVDEGGTTHSESKSKTVQPGKDHDFVFTLPEGSTDIQVSVSTSI